MPLLLQNWKHSNQGRKDAPERLSGTADGGLAFCGLSTGAFCDLTEEPLSCDVNARGQLSQDKRDFTETQDMAQGQLWSGPGGLWADPQDRENKP